MLVPASTGITTRRAAARLTPVQRGLLSPVLTLSALACFPVGEITPGRQMREVCSVSQTWPWQMPSRSPLTILLLAWLVVGLCYVPSGQWAQARRSILAQGLAG